MSINILAVGDVVGRAGLDMLTAKLRGFKKLNNVGFTVVNGENSSLIGISPEQADSIFSAGADVITLGNHTFDRAGISEYLEDCRYILRPANYAPQNPGRGYGVFDSPAGEICVINLIGRCDMKFGPDNPFLEVDRILKNNDVKITLVDFHAQATSEKLAMAYYLDGRASALWGTHTHVQTSDASVFSGGLGYITDVGMTGPMRSVIGVKPELSISMFRGDPPRRYEMADGPAKMECVLFEVDEGTGRCLGAEAFRVVE